jgi:hypothetical protein
MRKIFDGGDLKIYQVRNLKYNFVQAKDLKILVKGKDVSSSIQRIDIHIEPNNMVYYDIMMYSFFRKLMNKFKR